MSEQVRQQAQAEKLVLLLAENKTGYFGVSLNKPGQPKPYQAQVWRGGKQVHLGQYATAEEAALRVARSGGEILLARAAAREQKRKERAEATGRAREARRLRKLQQLSSKYEARLAQRVQRQAARAAAHSVPVPGATPGEHGGGARPSPGPAEANSRGA